MIGVDQIFKIIKHFSLVFNEVKGEWTSSAHDYTMH